MNKQSGEMNITTSSAVDTRDPENDVGKKDYSSDYFDTALLVSPASEYLHCTICLDLMKEPLQCPHCGNSYCAACVSRVLLTREECPTCCQALSASQLVINRALLGAIGDLVIKCPTTLDGTSTLPTPQPRGSCDWKGAIKDVPEHMRLCSYVSSVNSAVHKRKGESNIGSPHVAALGIESVHSESSLVSDSESDFASDSQSDSEYQIVDICEEVCPAQVTIDIDSKCELTDLNLSAFSDRQSLFNEESVQSMLSDDMKVQLHVYVDILMETCPYEILMISTRQFRQIVDFMMENYTVDSISVVNNDSSTTSRKISDEFKFMRMFDSLLDMIAENAADLTNVDKIDAQECLDTWTQFIDTIVGTDLCCLHDLVQQLIEICANLSDVADTMSPPRPCSSKGTKTTSESLSTKILESTTNTPTELKMLNSVSPVLPTAPPAPPAPSPLSVLPPTEAQQQVPLIPNVSAINTTPEIVIEVSPSRTVCGEDIDSFSCDTEVVLVIPTTEISSSPVDLLDSNMSNFVSGISQTSSMLSMMPNTKCLQNEFVSIEDVKEGVEKELDGDDIVINKISDNNTCDNTNNNAVKSHLVGMTIKELSDRIDLSVEDTVFLLIEASDDIISALGLCAVQKQLIYFSDHHMDDKSADVGVEMSVETIEALLQELQTNLESLKSICSSGGLDADVYFLSDCLRSNGIYVVDRKGDSYVLKSDRGEVCVMLGLDIAETSIATLDNPITKFEKMPDVSTQFTSRDAPKMNQCSERRQDSSEPFDISDKKCVSSDRRKEKVVLPSRTPPLPISVLDINSIVMTVKELSIIMEFSVQDTVFLLLEANDHMIAKLGLLELRNELAQNSMNNTINNSSDCIIELSSESIETLSSEVISNLESLTSICSSGGLDADVCFLSDCLRSNGIHVISWKGDNFVLKSNRRDVCMMLGIEQEGDEEVIEEIIDFDHLSASHPQSTCPIKYPSHVNELAFESNNSSTDSSMTCGAVVCPTDPNLDMQYSTFDINTDYDHNHCFNDSSEFSLAEFPPNSPALSHFASTEVQEMIQSGFSSTWDSSISDLVTLQDLACQWKINILSLIYLGERQVIPVFSPTHEAFSIDMCGLVTHDWYVRNERLGETLLAAHESLFNIVHLSDMFENISDICLALSKSQITVINWDEERFILQSDMEAAMEVCMNYGS